MNKPTIITSRKNKLVTFWGSLNKDKNASYILGEGFHILKMASEAGLLESLIFVDETDNIKANNYYQISKEIAEKLSEVKTSQNIFGLIKKPKINPDFQKNLLYLDNISDPGNMGTLIRTALALGFGGVIASSNSVSFYHPRVISAAQGGHFKISLTTSDDLQQYRDNGYKLVATGLLNAVDIDDYDFSEKTLVILGNEGSGVSQNILNIVDQTVMIKMIDIDSLNVGIAGGIVMYLCSKNSF